jgi:hypothetical protein
MATSGITSDGPIVMMDSDGAEIVVPLSALYVDGGVVKADHWPGFKHVVDQNGVTAWLQKLLADGTVGAAPPAQPQPAMVVRAAAPGSAGNGISVSVAVVTADPDPTKVTFDLSVALTQTYTGLTPATIESVLGSDLKPLPQPGLVDVVHDSIDVTKTVAVPKTYGLTGAGGAAKPRVDLVDKTPNSVVTLEANRRLGTTALQLSNINDVQGTFSITATWSETNAKTYTGLKLSQIQATLAADPTALATVTGPVGAKPPDATKTYQLPAPAGNTMPTVTVLDGVGGTAFVLSATPLTGAASVTFSAAVPVGADFTFDMTVTQTGAVETEQFDGVSLDTIEGMLGSDIAPTAPPKLIEVVHGTIKSGAKVAGPANVTFPAVAAGGQPDEVPVTDVNGKTVFALEANQSAPATTVAVAASSTPNAFDMTVTWTQTAKATTIGSLSSDAAKFGGVASVAPPPGSSFSVPAANPPGQPTALTGGADSARASATLFASTT